VLLAAARRSFAGILHAKFARAANIHDDLQTEDGSNDSYICEFKKILNNHFCDDASSTRQNCRELNI